MDLGAIVRGPHGGSLSTGREALAPGRAPAGGSTAAAAVTFIDSGRGVRREAQTRHGMSEASPTRSTASRWSCRGRSALGPTRRCGHCRPGGSQSPPSSGRPGYLQVRRVAGGPGQSRRSCQPEGGPSPPVDSAPRVGLIRRPEVRPASPRRPATRTQAARGPGWSRPA